MNGQFLPQTLYLTLLYKEKGLESWKEGVWLLLIIHFVVTWFWNVKLYSSLWAHQIEKNIFCDYFYSEHFIPHNAINVSWINDIIKLPLNHLVISDLLEICSFNIQNAIGENRLCLTFVGILSWCISFIFKFCLKAKRKCKPWGRKIHQRDQDLWGFSYFLHIQQETSKHNGGQLIHCEWTWHIGLQKTAHCVLQVWEESL